MGELIKFPDKFKGTAEKKEEKRSIDVNDLLAAGESLGLPAAVSEEIANLMPDIQRLSSSQKSTCKFFIQDLTIYGSALIEAALDFQKKNPKLASKIESLSDEARRALHHILS